MLNTSAKLKEKYRKYVKCYLSYYCPSIFIITSVEEEEEEVVVVTW
jgi:hypothetical protein